MARAYRRPEYVPTPVRQPVPVPDGPVWHHPPVDAHYAVYLHDGGGKMVGFRFFTTEQAALRHARAAAAVKGKRRRATVQRLRVQLPPRQRPAETAAQRSVRVNLVSTDAHMAAALAGMGRTGARVPDHLLDSMASLLP